MRGKCNVILAVLSVALVAVVLGCAGSATTGAKTPDQPEEHDVTSPYGGGGDLSDLKNADSAEEESFATDIKVPGDQWKKKPNKGGSTKHCPKGKKGKKCRKEASKKIPVSEAIKDQMAGVPWGLHYKAVLKKYEYIIKQSYAEALKNAGGAIEEDKVRTEMIREINKLKKSYVEFDGNRTGYEGVMIEKEFTHNNGESMLVWDAGKFVEYLFFFDNRFWKRLRTYRMDTFDADITFDTYIEKLSGIFGDGKVYRNDMNEIEEIMWINDDTYMAALDRSGFYGVYCQVLMARVTEDNLAKIRKVVDNSEAEEAKVSSVVESVTSGDLVDHNTSVIDQYTGSDSGGSGGNVSSHHSVMGGGEEDKPEGDKAADKPEDKPEDSGEDFNIFD